MKLYDRNSPDNANLAVVDDWVNAVPAGENDLNVCPDTNMGASKEIPHDPVGSFVHKEACVTPSSRPDRSKVPKRKQAPTWRFPSPVSTRLPTPPPPKFPQCSFWKKANSIYARIFDYDLEGISTANTVNSGALFKIVKEGWGSLTFRERRNPVLQILEEVDRYLFWDLDPVTKIANLWKSHLILKVNSPGDLCMLSS